MDIANEVRELILEATDWTYQDFKDATIILANRLNQLAAFCDVDVPGPDQAHAMEKVANMCRIYYDKCMKVFKDDQPVGNLGNPDANTERVMTPEEATTFETLLKEQAFENLWLSVKDSIVLGSFDAITKEFGYKVKVEFEISKLLNHRNLIVQITEISKPINKNKYQYSDLAELKDLITSLTNGLETFEKQHPPEQGADVKVA